MHLQITSDNDGGTCTGGMGGGGWRGQGPSTCKPLYTASYSGTSIQWGTKGLGKFACYIEGSLYWKPRFHKWQNKQNVHYIDV